MSTFYDYSAPLAKSGARYYNKQPTSSQFVNKNLLESFMVSLVRLLKTKNYTWFNVCRTLKSILKKKDIKDCLDLNSTSMSV